MKDVENYKLKQCKQFLKLYINMEKNSYKIW